MRSPSLDTDQLEIDAAESRLRLQTSVRLRWFAVLGQLAAVAVVYLGLGFSMPIGYCLLLIALSAWLNVFLRVRFRARHRLSPSLATGLLAYDMLQLAALLFLTGGIQNPFMMLIVAPVTVSAATLPPRNTILLGLIAAAATTALLLWHLPLPWHPGEEIKLPLILQVGHLAAVGACTAFLGLYTWRLSKESRQMSAALAATELVLAREQQLHALDGLAAAAAHELGTPLATILLVTKELERAVPPAGPFNEDIALLRSQALRCRDILRSLAKRPTEQDWLHSSVTITQLIDEVVEPYRALAIALDIDAAPFVPVDGAGAREPAGERRPGLIYGLGNLVENAVDFATARVVVTVRWDAERIFVSITDDGPGYAPGVIETLGEPYVTTRPLGGAGVKPDGTAGLGLGIFIAKTLLERSGATLELSNREPPGAGAQVRIIWPRTQFERRPTGAETDKAEAENGPDRSRGLEYGA